MTGTPPTEHTSKGLRLAAYTDYPYHRLDGAVYAERAFALFLAGLERELERLLLIGRLSPDRARARYELGGLELAPLPHYVNLAQPLPAMRAMAGSIRGLWRSLDEVDAVWLLGPHPLMLPFALIAWARRRRVFLGVRQDFPSYIASRHPGRRVHRLVARLLEGCFRLLARVCRTVVVGPQLARNYRHAHRLLEISVSLVSEREIVPPGEALKRSYDGALSVLSVGRLDAEKNPLALADALALLRDGDSRWRLTVCGEGPLEANLGARLRGLGLEGSAELRGYVPHDRGLGEIYRTSHVLLHVSWTEGLPQTLFEAFAAGLPVVATDVGGIADAVGEAALLIPPGDAVAAAEAVGRVGEDPALRRRLVEAGHRLVRSHTLETETARVAQFLGGDG